MARLFAYETTEYRDRLRRKQIIERGSVIEVDEATSQRLMADHADALLLLKDGENAPALPDDEMQTTMKARPDMNRHMLPGRISPQKKRLLKQAGKRSRHAYMTLTR